MTVPQKRERLHLRIEQADEQLLDVLSRMAEVLFSTYQSETATDEANLESAEFVTAYEASLKPMTKEQLIARAKASEEDFAAGRVYTVAEAKAELQL